MTAVWIALGAVAISLMTVFISLGAAKEAKRKEDSGDGGSTYASDTGDRDRTESDSGGNGGGGARQRRGTRAASAPLRLRAAPLHHPLRGRSPSPSKLGEE